MTDKVGLKNVTRKVPAWSRARVEASARVIIPEVDAIRQESRTRAFAALLDELVTRRVRVRTDSTATCARGWFDIPGECVLTAFILGYYAGRKEAQ